MSSAANTRPCADCGADTLDGPASTILYGRHLCLKCSAQGGDLTAPGGRPLAPGCPHGFLGVQGTACPACTAVPASFRRRRKFGRRAAAAAERIRRELASPGRGA